MTGISGYMDLQERAEQNFHLSLVFKPLDPF